MALYVNDNGNIVQFVPIEADIIISEEFYPFCGDVSETRVLAGDQGEVGDVAIRPESNGDVVTYDPSSTEAPTKV